MSLFYYRAWAGVESRGPGSVSIILREDNALYYTRWGYCALLGVTMTAGIILNLVYLAGYWAFPRAMLEVPHVAIVSLALRDLLVCVLVVPAALDWLVAGLTSWPGGEIWCKTAVFLDYYLSSLHPLLILMLCIILYSRKLPPKMTPPSPAPIVNTRYGDEPTHFRLKTDCTTLNISGCLRGVATPTALASLAAPQSPTSPPEPPLWLAASSPTADMTGHSGRGLPRGKDQ